MSNNKNLINDMSEKRKFLIEEINKEKFSYINITKKDNQANELYNNKIPQTFNFPEDFYYNLAMKYKKEIENHQFFNIL